MADVDLRCKCGAITGRLKNVTAASVNRIICHCADCQTFANYLGTGATDALGGTDITQAWPANIVIDQGAGNIGLLRLSPKGLNRWHATCCNTPIGNTLTPNWPFIGIPSMFLDEESLTKLAGPARGRIQAPSTVDLSSASPPVVGAASLARTVAWIARGKLTGKSKPNPYFQQDGQPRVEPRILTKAERDGHRP